MDRKPDQDEIEENGEEEDQADDSFFGKMFNFLFTGKAPVWTALATVMMMIFSGLLLRVTNVANEINMATQRATLSAAGPNFQKIPNLDGKTIKGFNVFYFWTNAGTAPVPDGKMQFNISLGNALPPGDANDFAKLPQSQTIEFVLGPKAGMQMSPQFISTEDMEKIGQGKEHLFIWGWATYHDGFPDTPMRLSEFCTDITSATWTKPDHTDITGDVAFTSPPCGAYNCYDERCKDYPYRTR
jgi:hypothetical protein